MNRKQVGMIGLGLIGGNIASCLSKKGYALCVYDANAELAKGFADRAEVCENPAAVLRQSPIVLLSLPNSEIVESVMEELTREPIEGKIILDLSTSYPLSTRAIAQRVAALGGAFLDVPLLAGPDEALAGTLTAMAAGDEESVKSCHSLLMDFCSHYDYVGESGNGHLIKILMNFTGLMYALLLGQMFPLAEKAGLDPKQLYKVMNNDVFSNWMYRFYAPKMIDRSFDMAFRLDLGLKDLTYIKKLYENYNVPAFALDGALDLLRMSVKDGKGKQDFSRCAQTMYELLGLPTEPAKD